MRYLGVCSCKSCRGVHPLLVQSHTLALEQSWLKIGLSSSSRTRRPVCASQVQKHTYMLATAARHHCRAAARCTSRLIRSQSGFGNLTYLQRQSRVPNSGIHRLSAVALMPETPLKWMKKQQTLLRRSDLATT